MNLVEPPLPRFTGRLRPLVNLAARIRASVHVKLLFGFLTGAAFLVALAALSLVVIGRMSDRVTDQDRLQGNISRAQQMLYSVTAQSHYRAMAILTGDASYNTKIADNKTSFTTLLGEMGGVDPADVRILEDLRSENERYAAASAQVLELYLAGDPAGATRLHLDLEHPVSHELEDSLHELIDSTGDQISTAQAAYESDRGFLTNAVIGFSLVSVAVALLLGFVLSWAFIIPIRKTAGALRAITAGDLTQRVDVPNGDELGQLTRDLNATSDRLAVLFDDQRALTGQLEDSNASLVRASEAKSRFLASVSHELRTPMNAILGFTDALLGGVDGPLNPDQKASLEWVQRGGRDLLGLINEILDLSKIESGKLTIDPQPFDPLELVESVVAQNRSLAAQKGIGFAWKDAGGPTEVVLDRQRVSQILVNLFGNALKFTQEGSVEVETSGADEAALRVAVRDSGPGIAADQLETIFEEFHQAEGDAAGSGLGLAISRRLARAMGGDITVESEPGRGSVFRLGLPLDCRSGSIDPTVGAAHAQPGPSRVILSVDDDPSVAPLLEKMVAGHGYRIVAATNATTAVSDARRLRPAAILLDVLMPGRDGRDILRELKADPDTVAIPVIVVSVLDMADLADVADGYLAKPVRKDLLLGMLSERCGPPRDDS